MPSEQSRIIEQTKSTFSPLGKAFEKQIKTIEEKGIKEVEALKAEENQEPESIWGIFPKKTRTNEIENEIMKLKNRKIKLNKKI